VLKARVEKEKRLPAAKGLRLGAYVSKDGVVNGVDEGQNQRDSQATVQEIEMDEPANPAGPPVPVRRKVRIDAPQDGPQKLSKLVAGMDGAAKLAERTMATEVFPGFSVNDSLSVPDVRRIVFSRKEWDLNKESGQPVLVARPTQRQIQPPAQVSSVDQIRVEPGLRMPRGKATPTLEVEVAGRQCIGMLDSGATINVMGSEQAERLGLAVSPLQGQHAVSFDGGRQRILGCLSEIPVRFGGVRVFSDVLIVEAIDPSYDIILGRPFQEAGRCQTWYDEELNTMIRLFDPATGSCETMMDASARIASLN
jgi:hypothetical protein